MEAVVLVFTRSLAWGAIVCAVLSIAFHVAADVIQWRRARSFTSWGGAREVAILYIAISWIYASWGL